MRVSLGGCELRLHKNECRLIFIFIAAPLSLSFTPLAPQFAPVDRQFASFILKYANLINCVKCKKKAHCAEAATVCLAFDNGDAGFMAHIKGSKGWVPLWCCFGLYKERIFSLVKPKVENLQ